MRDMTFNAFADILDIILCSFPYLQLDALDESTVESTVESTWSSVEESLRTNFFPLLLAACVAVVDSDGGAYEHFCLQQRTQIIKLGCWSRRIESTFEVGK